MTILSTTAAPAKSSRKPDADKRIVCRHAGVGPAAYVTVGEAVASISGHGSLEQFYTEGRASSPNYCYTVPARHMDTFRRMLAARGEEVTQPAKRTPKQPKSEAPLFQWVIKPTAGVGWLTIRGTLYRLAEVNYEESDGTPRMLVRLRKETGDEYQLTPDADGILHCDCPDAIYRERPTACKHAQAVTAAYAELDRVAALDVFLNDDDAGSYRPGHSAGIPF